MTEAEVIALMESSKSEEQWNANCGRVKAAFGGQYPPFWFPAIILSGLMRRVMGEGSDEIKIATF